MLPQALGWLENHLCCLRVVRTPPLGFALVLPQQLQSYTLYTPYTSYTSYTPYKHHDTGPRNKPTIKTSAKTKQDAPDLSLKKEFMKWSTKAQAMLQNYNLKNQITIEKISKINNTWCTKKFKSAAPAQADKAKVVLEKLMKLHSLSVEADDATFKSKKFTMIKDDVAQVKESQSNNNMPLKQAEHFLSLSSK